MAEWTEGEAKAWEDAVRASLMARGLRQTDLAELLTDAGHNVSQARVSQWITGVHEPPRRMVFAIEEALGVKPGALSRVLGYLPVNAKAVTTVEDAIAADPVLSPEGRRGVLGAYRALAH